MADSQVGTRVDGVVDLVDSLIRRAIESRASDLHFEPADDAVLVRFRVDALLSDVERLPRALAPNVAARLKVMSGLLTYRTDTPQEGAIDPARFGFPCDIRVASFPTVRGERIVLRLQSAAALITLEQLGHDPALLGCVRAAIEQPQGLFIVCGPAGSGKTTTLYAILDYLLKARPGLSILAVEDPVEIRLPGVTQIQIEPARGLTYAVALRSLLRQDPQILMVGEVRDAETAQMVVEAALTGHLLLTTLHSGSPAEAIVRMREIGVAAFQLTSTLLGVLSQRLVRRKCAACNGQDPAVACSACLGRGYAGRTAIGELTSLNADLRQAILAGADAGELANCGSPGASLAADARRVVQAGLTTRDEIKRVLGHAAF